MSETDQPIAKKQDSLMLDDIMFVLEHFLPAHKLLNLK